MPPKNATPSGWQSFADYLGLNEDALREIEMAAQARAAEADGVAASALGRSVQESQAAQAGGGEGNLTSAQSYMDFVKASRQAAEARRLPSTGMSREEQAAREAIRPASQGVDWNAREGAARSQLASSATGYDASRKAAADFRAKQQAERDAQNAAFAKARDEATPGWADRQRYSKYSDAVAGSQGPGLRRISQEEVDSWNP